MEAAKLITHIRSMADKMRASEIRYEGFDVHFSTARVGQFQDGVADNVVPRDAWFYCEFRNLPTADVVSMQKQMAFGTEAGVFKNAGISTVVCGPGRINQAHQPDEFVSLEQLARCEQFMQKLAATTAL